jgi:hypothetical protein
VKGVLEVDQARSVPGPQQVAGVEILVHEDLRLAGGGPDQGGAQPGPDAALGAGQRAFTVPLQVPVREQIEFRLQHLLVVRGEPGAGYARRQTFDQVEQPRHQVTRRSFVEHVAEVLQQAESEFEVEVQDARWAEAGRAQAGSDIDKRARVLAFRRRVHQDDGAGRRLQSGSSGGNWRRRIPAPA